MRRELVYLPEVSRDWLEGRKAVIVALLYARLNPYTLEAALKSRNP